MRLRFIKGFTIIAGLAIILFFSLILLSSEPASAGSYDGQDLALAILKNQSTFISSSYVDSDQSGHSQEIVLTSLGTMQPTNGDTFVLLSTGVAGSIPVTSDQENPVDETGTWIRNKYGHTRA